MSDQNEKCPALGAPCSPETHHELDRMNGLLDRLTGPGGCPWDSEQTTESLTEYVVEECHELVDALRSGNAADICEELGDVAFLLHFVARLSEKRGGPSLADALANSTAKMIRRHPHVFGDAAYSGRSEQLKDWDRIKREEKAASNTPKGTYDSLPRGLPPLTKAYRIHAKAAQAGFTWPENEEVERQVEAEWLELLDAMASGDEKAIAHEFGDHLFTLVELGRRQNLKAAIALDSAATRFLDRFERMEALARERGFTFADLSLDEKDELWNEIKAAEAPVADTDKAE